MPCIFQIRLFLIFIILLSLLKKFYFHFLLLLPPLPMVNILLLIRASSALSNAHDNAEEVNLEGNDGFFAKMTREDGYSSLADVVYE